MSAKSKIVISVGCLISTIVLIISTISFINFKNSSVDNYTYRLHSQSYLIANALNQYLEKYFETLILTAGEIPIDAQGTLDVEKLVPLLEKLNSQMATINAYIGIKSGDTFAASHKGLVPNFNAKEKNREWYNRGFAGEAKLMTTPYISGTGKLVMAMAVPVKRADKIVAVLAINLRVDQISQFIAELAEGNQTVISRKDGFVMASYDESHIGENAFEIFPSYQQHQNELTSQHSYTYQDKEYFVVSAKVDSFDWNVWSSENWQTIKADSSENALYIIAIALILVVVSLLIVYFLVSYLVYKPLGGEPTQIEKIIKDISQGNLTENRAAPEQASGIYAAILAMEINLAKVITQIHTMSLRLETSAESMVSVSEQVNVSSKQQMERLESTTVTMSQMTLSAEEVSSNAQNAATSADAAKSSTDYGITSVSNLNENIHGLGSSLQDVKEVILQLETESQNIGSILESIRSIAEQTNLLALNASIEAARAGDSGRGFAVVADEVRNLATRTQSSTDDIQKMIDLLQAASQHAVKLMHANVKDISEAGDKSEIANEQLNAIGLEVKNIDSVNALIASAACEQATVAGDINENIQAIYKLAEGTHKHSEETIKAAKLLTQESISLKDSVSEFKIN